MTLFRTRWTLAGLTSGLCLLLPALLVAASLELIEGKGTAVCEAYQSATRAWEQGVACMGDESLDGPGIARILGPLTEIRNGTDERYPEYALMVSAGEFITQHDINLAAYYYTFQLGEWRATPEQRVIAQREVGNRGDQHFPEGIQRTLEVDVNNDGTRDSVLFFPHCYTGSTATSLTMSAPLLLNETRTTVDVERTQTLLRKPIRYHFSPQPRQLPDGRWVADADFYSQSSYGFFSFKGRIYFDFRWDAKPEQLPDPNESAVLRVYLAKGSATRAVCAFRLASEHEK
jgi:hypothetical protein